MVKTVRSDNYQWYKDAVIYELHIKAFKDSNGDGIGDLKGLVQTLDYLEDLGVTAIWLLPFYPSPFKDDGYDISDYYKIHPDYGTIRDFKKFLNEAHNRNIKVITELVLNHTSDQHKWFKRAKSSNKHSVFRDYYVWTDDPDKYSDTRIIFNDFETSNWRWDPEAGQYYWHRFYGHQPDLNYDNPRVQQEIFKVIDYWLDMGVDGFRLDAVPYLFEREGTNCENLPQTHDFLKELRAHVDKKYKNKLLLAEANMWPEDAAAYFGKGDECHMNYHFPLMPRMFMALKMEDRFPVMDIFEQTPEIPDNCQWAMFLRNHDELTLEMVTDEERDYMYKMYTSDPKARINLGIRSRLAPLLNNNRKSIELLNFLLFSLPGTPVIYYGDEIGMGDNYYLGDRDGVRTPMQWTPGRNAGFSSANPNRLYLPVNLDPEYQYEAVNVETQQRNPSSLYWWMKRMINVRKQVPAFGRGSIKFLSPDNAKVLSFLRVYKDEIILVMANLSRFSQAAEIDLSDYKDFTPIELFSRNEFPLIKEEPYLFTLTPHGYYWFKIEKREKEIEEEELNKPLINISNIVDILKTKNTTLLENKIFPNYFRNCRWFGGKGRKIRYFAIMDHIVIPINGQEVFWLIIEVQYTEGMPEFYQLPLTITNDGEREDLNEMSQQALIAPVTMNGERKWLFDAVYSEGFRRAIFEAASGIRKGNAKGKNLFFQIDRKARKNFFTSKDEVTSRVLGAEQSNTSFIFSSGVFVKLYRKLDTGINPDLEITRFLSEKTSFNNIPDYVGSIEFKLDQKNIYYFGLMQELVDNEGDAWEYFEGVIMRYFENVLASPLMKDIPLLQGEFTTPLSIADIPEDLQTLIGPADAEMISLLGSRTAEMHIALASNKQMRDFIPESSSVHYQRSLYSSIQSLVRQAYKSLSSNLKTLNNEDRINAEYIIKHKNELLVYMKKIYSKKIRTKKIRNHGDYHLGQVLFTGKDFIIIDFEGEPARAYSERRLKRSPLRDVAGMLRSFHYASHNALNKMQSIGETEAENLEYWADLWYHYMGMIFMEAYMEKMINTGLIPVSEEELSIILPVFLIEKAVYELNYELNNRPEWVNIPIRGIQYIIDKYLNK
jgi:maltose alpha-D-glucosyltransferase/alpha-amylase